MSEATLEKIKQQITGNPIILYMKGSPDMPQCGFSARVTQIMSTFNIDYAFVDVLANPDIRQHLPAYAQWPTFPQLYINGELIGGCDIVCELYDSGELAQMIQGVNGAKAS